MSDNQFDEKVGQINPKLWHPEDVKEMNGWRERSVKLSATKDWIGHPETRNWMAAKQKEIARIKALLTDDPDMPEGKRQRLFGEKAAHEFDLSMFNRNPDAEMKNLEQKVDEALLRQKEIGS